MTHESMQLLLYVMPFITTACLVWVGFQARRRGKEFSDLAAFLQDQDFTESDALDKIDVKLTQYSEDLRSAWRSFSAGLVLTSRGLMRGTESADHFHSGDLLDPVLKQDFFRHLPGILTGIGIICTFSGMRVGLAEASMAVHLSTQQNSSSPSASPSPAPSPSAGNTEASLTKMTEGLLDNIRPAIELSLCAVACAIAFLFVERYLYSSTLSKLHHLQRVIDRKFGKLSEGVQLQSLSGTLIELVARVSEAEVSRKIDAANQLQVQQSLNTFTNTIPALIENAVQNVMAPLVERQTTAVSESNLQVAGSVDKVGLQLQQALEQLEIQVSHAADTMSFSEQSMHSLKQFSTDIAVMMENALQNVMQPLVAHQTTKFAESHEALSGSVDQMGLQLQKALEKIQEDATSASGQAMSGLVEHFQDTLAKNSQSQIQEMLKSIEGVSGLLSGQREAQEHFVQKISELFLSSEERARDQQEEVTLQMRQLSGDVASEMTRTQQEVTSRSVSTLNTIGQEVAQHLVRSQDHQQQVLSTMRTDFSDSLSALSQQIAESSSSSVAGFQGLLNSVESLAQHIAKSTEHVFTESSKSTMDSVTALSQAMLASSRTHNEELTETMRQFKVGFETSLLRLSTQVESSNQSSKETSQSLLEAAKALSSHVESSSKALASTLESGATNTLSQVSQNLSKLTKDQMGEVQQSIQQSLAQLAEGTRAMLQEGRSSQSEVSGLLKEFVRKLDGLGDSTRDNTERFAATVSQATNDIERLLGGMDTPLSRMKLLADSYVKHIEQLETVAGIFDDASDALKNGGEQLSTFVRDSQTSRNQTERALSLVVEQGKSIEKYQQILSQTLEQTREQADLIRQFVQSFQSEATASFSQMKSDAENYTDAFQGGAKAFLKEVDLNLATGTGRLSGAIEDLADVLDELRDLSRFQPGAVK